MKKLRDELDWVRRSLSALETRPELKDKFIAVKDGKIIDTDRDNMKLAKRIKKNTPDKLY